MTKPAAAEPEATPGPARGPSPSRGRFSPKRVFAFDEIGIGIALLLLVGLVGVFHPEFLSRDSLIDLVRQASFVSIMAFGMVFLLAMGDVDLSVGAIYVVTIIGAGTFMRDGVNPWVAVVLGVALGAALGAVNGLLSFLVKVPVIVVTLGTLSMFRGLALVWSDGRIVTGAPTTHAFFTVFGGDWLGIPAAVWVLAILVVVLTWLFKYTRFGLTVRSIGSNPKAARFSGLPIVRTRILVLALLGSLCGVSGMLTLAFFAAPDPTLGAGIELPVIAAAIIGGTSLAGGAGTVLGALLGALAIQVINSGIVFFGVPSNWGSFVTGAVIILAVGTDTLLRRSRSARQAASTVVE